jgi:ABC-type lipoprotein export system ATPase subunit
MTGPGFAVEARGLGKDYRNVQALRECSFALPAGRIIALVGANGAGKSTLMSIIAGLERLCPSGDSLDREFACFAGNHLTNYVEYQPGRRIPEFHLILGAGHLALAAVAVAAVWLLVRRTNLTAG